MIKYYFHWLPEDEIEKCADSDKAVFRVIRKSTYSDTEKSRLYDFFTEPHWYIQQLKYELISKERQLFSYYEKNYFRILDLYNGLVMENLISQLKSVNELFFSEKEEKERYLSFCLLNKDCLLFTPVEEGVVYLLGYNYEDAVEYLQEQKTSIKLSEFGSALAEESRLKILEVMSERGEITCKDLEKACEFSGSTAYHHLMTLLKYGVIKSRNEGKAVLYSVNTKSFDFAIRILSRYAGHKENTAK
ncbi:MAG: winged helix-turn-helix transcriptional regulator [Clostridia bacterium]|nr:winged helix-turn-helix transcriptional regulator [Clostridia bacterium]